MRKTLLTLIIAVSSSLSIFAQTPNWKWAETQTGSSSYMQGMGIGVSLSTGNVYFNYRSGSAISFGGSNATGGSTWVGSCKVNNAGIGAWTVAHSSSFDYCYGFGLDNNDNSYTTGIYNSGSGYFVDKTDATGHIVWTTPSVSGPSGYGNIAIDKLGNVYVCGNFNSGTSNFGGGNTVTVSGVGAEGIFLAKYEPVHGNCVWVKSAGANSEYDGARGVYIDPAGQYLYMVGAYNGTATFGSITTPAANAGYPSAFIAKYDLNGNAIWVNTATNAGFGTSFQFWNYNGITVDSSSNVYITGHFVNTANFVNASGTAFGSAVSAGGTDIFVAKCLSSGNWEWVEKAGGTGSDYGMGVALDKHSDVYLTGYFATGTATFGSASVSTTAANAVFVAKYNNSSGAVQWVQAPTSSSGASNAQWISVDDTGYAYITGNAASTGFSITNTGTTTTTGSGCLIAKIDTVAPRRIMPTVSPNYCAGQTASIPYSIVGTFNAGNNFIAQLSDANGSFAAPTQIGINNSTIIGGSISVTIPSTASGSNYLIRVVSTNPATSSWASGAAAYKVTSVYPENFYVTINSVLTLNVTPANPTVCNGSSIKLKETNGPAGTTYTWTGSGSGSTGDSAIMNPTTATPVTVTASSGLCTGTTTLTVNVNPLPTVGIGAVPVAVCAGGSTVITATGGTSYSWNNGSTTSSISVSPTSSTFEYVVTDTLAGCYAKDSMTITVNPTPTITASNSVALCSGAMTPLSANGAGLNGTYVWNPIYGLDTAKGPNTKSTPTITTTYTITGRTFVGCADSTMVTVTVNSNPVPSVSTMQAICAGGSTPLSASGGTDYTWAPVTGLSSSTIAAPNASPAASTQYTVTVSNGTCQATDTVTVAVNSLPEISVTGANTILIGDGTPISVSAATGNTYSWSPSSSLSCSTCANPVATPTTTTLYTVTVTNGSNCSDTGSVLVTVKEVCGPVYVPNAFSPNGDGSNDALKVMGNCIKGMELTIFDRWGNVVYESTNPNAQWDGTSKGRVLNTGTYVYTLAATDVDNNTINKKGNITLLR